MPRLAIAFLILLLVAPASAFAQAGTSYQIPPDNPFAGPDGAADEVYALGLRNPFRFSFDRATGDVLIGDVGGGLREEIDWVTQARARAGNFGWACREGAVAGPRPDECPVTNGIEPLFDYPNAPMVADAVTGGFVVRDPALDGLVGRALYADYYDGEIFSLNLEAGNAQNTTTGATVPWIASFGEDASGRLYAASHLDGEVLRLDPGATSGTLDPAPLTGPFSEPIAIGTYPGDATRLFVGEKGGKVRLVDDGAALSTPYLDVAPFGITTGGERGLLSVVAAPDYQTSGKIYVYYTDNDPGDVGDIHIEEFTRSAVNPDTADPLTRRTVLVIEHSSEGNHNGGQMHFGADGCMWITTGDGGGQNNEHDNSQNLATLLGKLLRIDPDPPGVGGPACGTPASQPPGPGTPPGGNGNGTADTVPPGLEVQVPPRQRVLRRRGAIVYVRCDEACRLNVGGTLLMRGRRHLLRRAAVDAAAGRRHRLLVRLRPRAVRLLRRRLARGGRPRVALRVRANDAAGNRSPLVRRGTRVRR